VDQLIDGQVRCEALRSVSKIFPAFLDLPAGRFSTGAERSTELLEIVLGGVELHGFVFLGFSNLEGPKLILESDKLYMAWLTAFTSDDLRRYAGYLKEQKKFQKRHSLNLLEVQAFETSFQRLVGKRSGSPVGNMVAPPLKEILDNWIAWYKTPERAKHIKEFRANLSQELIKNPPAKRLASIVEWEKILICWLKVFASDDITRYPGYLKAREEFQKQLGVNMEEIGILETKFLRSVGLRKGPTDAVFAYSEMKRVLNDWIAWYKSPDCSAYVDSFLLRLPEELNKNPPRIGSKRRTSTTPARSKQKVRTPEGIGIAGRRSITEGLPRWEPAGGWDAWREQK
jgi:hypothetical protein